MNLTKSLGAALAVLALLGAGCTPTTTSVPRPAFRPVSPDEIREMAFNLDGGTMPDRIPADPAWILPAEVDVSQIHAGYRLVGGAGDKMNVGFAFMMRRNGWYPLMQTDGTLYQGPDTFGGVLFTMDEGATWGQAVESPYVTDESGPVAFNPVGVSIERVKNMNSYVVDFADDRGAGSGEGTLLRYRTTDGDVWTRDKQCYYYVPETYTIPFSQKSIPCPAYVK